MRDPGGRSCTASSAIRSCRDTETHILPFAEREGIGVIVYSPMGSGLLTGAMTPEQVGAIIDAAGLQFTDDDLATIEGSA